MYFIKTPRWLKRIYSNYVWHIPPQGKDLYLTFDDGPHPVATPFVLDELKKHQAKATFFCLGKNVLEFPDVYRRITDEGHAVGNHTHNHLNGWKTEVANYIGNVKMAANHINSKLFRPPYGRIKKQQGTEIKKLGFEIVMWDVLSGDFDVTLQPSQCLENITRKARAGSIVVFHDSEKAFNNLKFALPGILDCFSANGYRFKAISGSSIK